MPTYVYKFIETGETIEIQQSFSDDTLTEAVHPESGETLAIKKVFLPVGVTFKGDGFYKTDSRSAKKPSAAAASTKADSSSSTATDSSSSSKGSSDSSSSSSTPSSTPSTTPSSTSSD